MERGTDGRKQGHDAWKTAKTFASRTDNKDIKKETVFLGKSLRIQSQGLWTTARD